jgi:polysaccharide deacetylase 2 family uncharacterized protein YibQ
MMAADDLNKPLGFDPEKASSQWRFLVPGAAAVVAAAGVGAAMWLALPAERGPTVTAVIDAPGHAPPIAPERTGSTPPAPLAEVAAPTGGLSDVGDVVIHDASDPSAIALAALPDSALIETTDDGPLPRVAPDGTRPLDAYARPDDSGPRQPRIAIVVGGIGIDAETTWNAISTLPGDVTLAFAPYGDDLAAALANARGAGHEILLQVPLEPFNYPKTNPGPNTLTTDAAAEENISRLRWILGRLTGYVGVTNYMGGRFTLDPAALAPLMSEIGGRGLLYLDDGSSPRSRAGDAAQGLAPFLRADMVLDADLSAAAIDERLRQLQGLARSRGFAIATATAFPVTVERVAAFARNAAAKGIAIVPVTALLKGRT